MRLVGSTIGTEYSSGKPSLVLCRTKPAEQERCDMELVGWGDVDSEPVAIAPSAHHQAAGTLAASSCGAWRSAEHLMGSRNFA